MKKMNEEGHIYATPMHLKTIPRGGCCGFVRPWQVQRLLAASAWSCCTCQAARLARALPARCARCVGPGGAPLQLPAVPVYTCMSWVNMHWAACTHGDTHNTHTTTHPFHSNVVCGFATCGGGMCAACGGQAAGAAWCTAEGACAVAVAAAGVVEHGSTGYSCVGRYCLAGGLLRAWRFDCLSGWDWRGYTQRLHMTCLEELQVEWRHDRLVGLGVFLVCVVGIRSCFHGALECCVYGKNELVAQELSTKDCTIDSAGVKPLVRACAIDLRSVDALKIEPLWGIKFVAIEYLFFGYVGRHGPRRLQTRLAIKMWQRCDKQALQGVCYR